MDVLELHDKAHELLLAALAGGSLQDVADRVKTLVADVSADDLPRLLTVVVVEVGTRNVSQAHRGLLQARFELAQQRLAAVRKAQHPDPFANVVPLSARRHP